MHRREGLGFAKFQRLKRYDCHETYVPYRLYVQRVQLSAWTPHAKNRGMRPSVRVRLQANSLQFVGLGSHNSEFGGRNPSGEKNSAAPRSWPTTKKSMRSAGGAGQEASVCFRRASKACSTLKR